MKRSSDECDDCFPGSTPPDAKSLKLDSRLSLFGSSKYSDFTIVCQGQEFPVHKAIVCPESELLDRICSSNFKESDESRLVVDEEDPEFVRLMLSMLYGQDCPICADRENGMSETLRQTLISRRPQLLDIDVVNWVGSNGRSFNSLSSDEKNDLCATRHFNGKRFVELTEKEQDKCLLRRYIDYTTFVQEAVAFHTVERMTFTAHLYAIADVFRIESLKNKAKLHFEEDMLVMSDPYYWKTKWCYLEDFGCLIDLIYRSTPEEDRGLKKLFEDSANDMMAHLLNLDTFKTVLKENPNLAVNLLEKAFAEPRYSYVRDMRQRYKCMNCRAERLHGADDLGRKLFCRKCDDNKPHVLEFLYKAARRVSNSYEG